MRDDITDLGDTYSFTDVARVLERNDYYAVTDVLPEMSKGMTMEQMTDIIDMSRAKKSAVADRAKVVGFPSYDEMVDMLNNADSYEEIISILDKYNYCGVRAVLPAVMVLTDEEKRAILVSRESKSNTREM